MVTSDRSEQQDAHDVWLRALTEKLATLWASARNPDGTLRSSSEVARQLDVEVSRQYVAELRKGEIRHPRADVLQALAHFFDAPLEALLDRRGTDETAAERAQAELRERAYLHDIGAVEFLAVYRRLDQRARQLVTELAHELLARTPSDRVSEPARAAAENSPAPPPPGRRRGDRS